MQMDQSTTGLKWAGFGILMPAWTDSSSSPSSSSDRSIESQQDELSAIAIRVLNVPLNSCHPATSSLIHDHLSPTAVTMGSFPDPRWSSHSQRSHNLGGMGHRFHIHEIPVSPEVTVDELSGWVYTPTWKRPIGHGGRDGHVEAELSREWVLRTRWRWSGRRKWKVGSGRRARWACDRLEMMTAAGGSGIG
ncbi:hypothetical protein LTR53_006840 [Teratosphaeriaceae sp. CCFEE 6253]|nr:hypothetical protein LTR53_006840 [Teratosphaeriaceae sp. CCFEE 6253]